MLKQLAYNLALHRLRQIWPLVAPKHDKTCRGFKMQRPETSGWKKVQQVPWYILIEQLRAPVLFCTKEN